ncbi:hypothetical protein ZWY2020_011565 [Hordeum vulgare]|nr:hypothetical protein ZWY2020_011565 [Hordeum vulgare]
MASLPCPIPLLSACPRMSRRCLFHPRALTDGRDAPPHADPARSVPGPPLHSLAAPPRASVAAELPQKRNRHATPPGGRMRQPRRRAAGTLPGGAVQRRGVVGGSWRC